MLVACHIVTALQAIVARNVQPARHRGGQRDRDPRRRRLQRDPADRPRSAAPCARSATRRWTWSKTNMKRIAAGVAAAFGATAEVDFRRLFAPLVNDADGGRRCSPTSRPSWSARSNVDRERDLIMASEDFSFMLESAPGRLHQHRQRRHDGQRAGAQSRLRLQRRDPADGRRRARRPGREEDAAVCREVALSGFTRRS